MDIKSFKLEVGKRLKAIRTTAGVKQKELAAELEITPSLLSMYERGDREPSLSFIYRFVEHFNLSLSQFFTLVEEEQQEMSPDAGTLMKDLKKLIASLEKKALKRFDV